MSKSETWRDRSRGRRRGRGPQRRRFRASNASANGAPGAELQRNNFAWYGLQGFAIAKDGSLLLDPKKRAELCIAKVGSCVPL